MSDLLYRLMWFKLFTYMAFVLSLGFIFGTLAGCTALEEAARHGNTERVRALLDAGHQDGMGQAFWYATCAGHTEIAQLLLEKDAKRLEGIYLTDRYNPLHCAVERGHLETVALLLRYGATPDKRALDLANQKGVRVDCADVRGGSRVPSRDTASTSAPSIGGIVTATRDLLKTRRG